MMVKTFRRSRKPQAPNPNLEMPRHRGARQVLFITVTIAIAGIACGCLSGKPAGAAREINRLPRLYPDYSAITVPPNIAPLNFLIMEKGRRFFVRIRGARGRPLEIKSASAAINIPLKQWRSLLIGNKNAPVFFDVYVFDGTAWNRFLTFADTVAAEPADPYMVYRKINVCVRWMNMGIFQRRIEDFSERPLLTTNDFPGSCMNCHCFRRNDPREMIMQFRGSALGTPMLVSGRSGGVEAIDTKTSFCSGRAGFSAWHPIKNIIAFSLNNFTMLYHTAARELRDVFDRSADLALYLEDAGQVVSTCAIADPRRMETWPEWSPDGSYLYFCSAPQVPREQYEKVKDDLMRIPYNCANGAWGRPDTVLTAGKIGGSITQPRFSPDGRYCMITVSPYSDFPIHQAASRLYMISMKSSEVRKLEISGEYCDVWHCWSSNSRWIVFTSKRMEGRFGRPFFSYIDGNGHAHKAFVLPQRDPAYYRSLILSYNVPELITGPVDITREQFARALKAKNRKTVVDGTTKASASPYPAQTDQIE